MQTTGKNRNTIDKFYTNPDIVKKYIDKFTPHLKPNDLIIEPSAGSGVWTIPLRNYNLIAFDIQPEAEGIQQAEHMLRAIYILLETVDNLAKHFKRICVVKTQIITFVKSFKKNGFKKATKFLSISRQ